MKNYKPRNHSFSNKSRYYSSSENLKNSEAKPNYLFGIHPVEEAVQKDYRFRKLWLQKSDDNQNKSTHDFFINYCRTYKIQFRFADKQELDERLAKVGKAGANHQGVLAELKEGTRFIEDLPGFLSKSDENLAASKSNQPSIILITDHITDQQNLGAMARTAYYFGCRLIITEDHHSAPIDSTVHKTSAGASLLLPFYRCEKIAKSIEELKSAGYQIISTSLPEINSEQPSENTTLLSDFKLATTKVAVIMGAEGDGVRPHLNRLADHHLTIQHQGDNFDSLNVSVATGIILYQLTV